MGNYLDTYTYEFKENLKNKDNEINRSKKLSIEELKSDKIQYSKNKEEILAEGNVFFKDSDGVIIETEIALYDKRNQIIKSGV